MPQTKGKPELIHPTAVVHPDAMVHPSTTIGAYSVIGKGVVLGPENEILNHVSISGPSRIGRGNRFFPYCSVGQDPQDKKFHGESDSMLEMGDNNLVREFVTINRGSEDGGGVTRIGNNNWIMAYCHIAHDCMVGNDTIFANAASLAGHVTIADKVYLGGFTAVHQFCAIGEMTMTGGHSMITQDVPPYVIAVGNRANLFGVNKIGLERQQVPKREIQNIEKAYRIFFRSNLPAQEALTRLETELGESPAVRKFIAFVRASTRGICR